MVTKTAKWSAGVAGVLLGIMTTGAFAQGRQQGGPAAHGQGRQGAMSGMRDRDRMMDRSGATERDRSMDQDRQRRRDQDMDRIYGGDLMTDTERAEYQTRLRALTTQRERIEYRQEHQRQMQERARERGVALPPVPGS